MLKLIPPDEFKRPEPFPHDYPAYGVEIRGYQVILLPFRMPAFDSEVWTPSLEYLTFFQRCLGQPYALEGHKRSKDASDTNMAMAGQFPNPVHFEMRALSMNMSGVESDVEALRANGYLRICLSGNRILAELPMSFIPDCPRRDLGLDVRDTIHSSEAHQFIKSQMIEMCEKASGWQLSVTESGIILGPTHPFNISIHAPKGLVKDYIKIQVILDGIQYLPW